MVSTILQLSQLIASSATQLVDVCAVHGLIIPELNDPYTPDSEALRKNPTALRAMNNIAAAAFQLIACVLPPEDYALQVASSHYKSSALRVAIGCHVPEILHEAGEQGLHADEIAEKTGVDGVKIARLLRTLTNRHIFREVKENVFTNNRVSSALNSGKSLKQISNDPEAKYDNTRSRAAYIEIMADEGHKSSAYILENIQDPVTAHSEELNHAPFARGHDTKKGFYEWHAEPSQAYRRRRFAVAMGSWFLDFLVELFDWDALPNDALIVDLGGGSGTFTRLILSAHPKLKFVVQDIPAVIENSVQFWNSTDPGAIMSGRVRLQAHDFFTPQPITNAAVFVVKHVLHNWPKPYITKMLTELRNAASPDTILSIFDAVLVPSTRAESEFEIERVSAAQGLEPPDTLSTGYNSIDDTVWMLDTAVMALFNSQQHTLRQFDELLRSTGWKIVKVVLSGSFCDNVQAKPI